jgi:glycosyltransferase involved in cell wall biosynthesis
MGIGLTMSETDGIPQFWVDYCNLMDRILVPSRFNLRTFRSSGVKEEKIRVVPLAVNSEQFTPEGPKLLPKGIDGSTFKFLSVGEWIPRKGYDILIKSFVQEFSSEDDVCLLLRCHSNNSDYDPNGLRISKEIKLLIKKEKKNNPPKIILLPQTLSSMDMPSLYRGVNCFVLATRGEGWNMPVFEALASGVPVITTNWSAHTEHLNHRNAYLVDIEGLEPIPPYGLFVDEIYVGHFWARPSVEHLRYQMRYVYRNYEEAKKSAQVGRKMVLSDLRWELTAEKIVGCFAELT